MFTLLTKNQQIGCKLWLSLNLSDLQLFSSLIFFRLSPDFSPSLFSRLSSGPSACLSLLAVGVSSRRLDLDHRPSGDSASLLLSLTLCSACPHVSLSHCVLSVTPIFVNYVLHLLYFLQLVLRPGFHGWEKGLWLRFYLYDDNIPSLMFTVYIYLYICHFFYMDCDFFHLFCTQNICVVICPESGFPSLSLSMRFHPWPPFYRNFSYPSQESEDRRLVQIDVTEYRLQRFVILGFLDQIVSTSLILKMSVS